MLTTEQRQLRAQLASTAARAARSGDPSAVLAVEAKRREYRFVSAQEYVRDLVDTAPPLTADQRDQLAAQLRGGGTDG